MAVAEFAILTTAGEASDEEKNCKRRHFGFLDPAGISGTYFKKYHIPRGDALYFWCIITHGEHF